MRSVTGRHWRSLAELGRASIALLVVAPLLVWAFAPTSVSSGGPQGACEVVVYGYSALEPVMNDRIFPAFRQEWIGRTGRDVDLIASFAGSGTVTNQILFGAPADVAILAREGDAARLVDAGLAMPDAWTALPHRGVVATSPVVLLVRKGNPLGIGRFSDLARPGVRIIHPDPATSGAGSWALIAEGLAATSRLGDREAARREVADIWGNVVAQVASARAGRTQFAQGYGDVLITYEQEVLFDRTRGRLSGELVRPLPTIRTESLVVRTNRHRSAPCRDAVDAFVGFLWEREAQSILERYGFRPPSASPTDDPEAGTTIAALGGWSAVEHRFLREDPAGFDERAPEASP